MVLDEFFRIAFREKVYESLEALQAGLDVLLIHYITVSPHRGYRNMGRNQIATMNYSSKMKGKSLCCTVIV